MSSNPPFATHHHKIIKQDRDPSFNPLFSSLQNILIDQFLYAPNLYNCFTSNSPNFDQNMLNAPIKNAKKEGLSKLEAGKQEILAKIAQIKDIPQETTFIDSIVSEKGQGNQQCQTSSISASLSQEEAPPFRETNQQPSCFVPVFQISPFEIELFQNEQQKGTKPLLKRKNKGGKKIDNEREAKLREVEELLLIYNLQKIERNPKQKMDISKYQTKTVRFLYRLSKKGLKRDQSIELAFNYGKQMKTMADFHKTLEVLKKRVASQFPN